MSGSPTGETLAYPAQRIVVVGASLAGLRGAEAIRSAGHRGSLIIVGAEVHPPYDRPPLSKHVLTGDVSADATTLPGVAALDAEWRLGCAASGLDRTERLVHLADGSAVVYDRLLIATGARARAWPKHAERAFRGVHTVRDREDAAALRTALEAKPNHVVIIGTGFIGCEVAAACRTLGLEVTMVGPTPAPLAAALGVHLGSVIGALHEARGVTLLNGSKVEHLIADEGGRVVAVELSDGDRVAADVVVVALGAVRNTEWLQGSGLSADEGGLDCDAHGFALDEDGQPDTSIVAAGDVARFPHPLYDGRRVALEHWSHAVAQGQHAGRILAGGNPTGDMRAEPYAAIPTFWSTQHGINIKSAGLTEGADELVIAQGDPKEGRFLAVYGRQGRCIAAVAIDSARWLPAYAAAIEARAPFPPILEATDRALPLSILSPGFADE